MTNYGIDNTQLIDAINSARRSSLSKTVGVPSVASHNLMCNAWQDSSKTLEQLRQFEGSKALISVPAFGEHGFEPQLGRFRFSLIFMYGFCSPDPKMMRVQHRRNPSLETMHRKISALDRFGVQQKSGISLELAPALQRKQCLNKSYRFWVYGNHVPSSRH
ncbi:hypothetical protein [Rhodoferax sp. U11-2br]|uniref:hypothetical protein n=1 Tax=Rhodoferax sp. U11-2br TaxID=2838878 RepID=UPI001BED3BBE|nr:hypothetical protein [Rhodoferax sp. U11-2br]MBT3066711.1 hypothetical protein [Rhodoferax sp. U11-2br]